MPGNLVNINNTDEWYVGDSRMPELIAALERIGGRTGDNPKWELCDSDVADQFRIRTIYSGGVWGPWTEMPEDLKGRRLYNGFDHMVQHRCKA